MKKLTSVLLAVILAFACVTQSALALDIVPYQSDYLDSYGARIAHVGGTTMDLTFWVFGTRTMDKVGVVDLVIWEDDGDGWREFASYYNQYTYNDSEHFDSIIFQGQYGCRYKAVMTAYAGKGGGYDTRTTESIPTWCYN